MTSWVCPVAWEDIWLFHYRGLSGNSVELLGYCEGTRSSSISSHAVKNKVNDCVDENQWTRPLLFGVLLHVHYNINRRQVVTETDCN